MKVKIEKKQNPNLKRYNKEDVGIALRFASSVYKELGSYLKGIILFGSTSRKSSSVGDIDVLLVLDDITIDITPEFTQTYRLVIEKLVGDVSTKLHITTLKYTSFWEYVRNGDPIAVNILRDGYPLIDTGFFEPLQALLYQGRIRYLLVTQLHMRPDIIPFLTQMYTILMLRSNCSRIIGHSSSSFTILCQITWGMSMGTIVQSIERPSRAPMSRSAGS